MSFLPSTCLPRRARLVLFALLFASSFPALAQNLVQNPGFETGNFTDWVVTDATSGSSLSVIGIFAHTGSHSAFVGASGHQFDSISQNLLTIAGAHYTLTFWLEELNPSYVSSQFQALWNGTVVFNLLSVNSTFGYREETISGLVAAGASTPLVLQGYGNPSVFTLDDVSVVFNSPPIPPALYWNGAAGDQLWTSANWAANTSGTAANSTPQSITGVTFSSTGAVDQNTTLGANFTIKSLTIDDPAAVTISGANTLTVSGTAGTTGITVNAGAGRFTVNSSLVLGAGSRTVTISNTAGAFFNGSVGGAAGLTKAGPGALVLSGSDSYTGTTTLNGGMLVVNNPHALGTGNIVVNSGVLTADPQPINVRGNYTQTSKGSLLLHIGDAADGHYDFLNVTGHATLAGALILAPAFGSQVTLGDTITLIRAGGGVSGHFSLVDTSALFPGNTLAQPSVSYNGTSILLGLAQSSFTTVANTPNERSVAKDLDRVATDPRSGLIAFLDSQQMDGVRDELDLLSPADLSSIYQISYSAASIQQGNIEDRLENARAGSTGFTSALSITNPKATQYAGGSKEIESSKSEKNPLEPSPDNPWGLFISGNGDFVAVDADSNAKGYDFTTGGVTLGLDYRVNKNFILGAAFDYAHTWTNISQSGSIDADSGRGGIYASIFNTEGLFLNGYAGGGYTSYDTHRAALLGFASSNSSGAEFDTFLTGGYEKQCRGFIFGPVASVEYSYVGLNGFHEHGSAAPLNIVNQAQSSLLADLGFQVSYPMKHGHRVITPRLKASWQHQFAYSALPVDARFANGEGGVFQVVGPSQGRDSAVLEASVNVQWTPELSTYLGYFGTLNPDYSSNAVNGGVGISF